MTTKFLLIDDEPSAESYAAAIAAGHPSLSIEPIEVRDPKEIVSHIEHVGPDGLLIDLELTRSRGRAREHFKIQGTALTQEFRTRSNRLSALVIPMVSLSYTSRRAVIVGQDTTASDLFDAELSKSDVSGHAIEIAERLVDLAKGYRTLKGLRPQDSDGYASALGLAADDYDRIDARVNRDLSTLSNRPLHNFSRFLLQTLLPFSGPLINTEMLAIRLGVDAQKSGDAWSVLLSKLPKKVQYKGVFSKSQPLWWITLIDNWWHSSKDTPGSLPMLSTHERVEFLKKRFALQGLKAIESSTKSPGTRFWTVCERTGLPVDPPEGYAIVDDDRMRSWHDKRYLCRNAALRYVQESNFEPGEKDRLKKFGKARLK